VYLEKISPKKANVKFTLRIRGLGSVDIVKYDIDLGELFPIPSQKLL
jgi:hypothetical protein